ncbi:hypothetical protein JHK85_006532 [Glycine max]|nr:hypothetical protein JHK85_006532 [Glycine max]
MILEVSQYLENYLWPYFDPLTATFEHVMSIIIMVNEKFRENVAAWTCFHERKDAFKGFLESVLRLKEILDSQVFPLKQLSGEDDELIDATSLGLVNDACVLYCERFMEFLIDLLSQLTTRRYSPPKGELRTVTVALDTAQYHMDVSNIAEKGAEDVYGTFNVLMRRKPKENNFEAILESIRDLMNEYCIVPKWLENIFLGYGDPSAAQWTNMPDILETVDFKDTFVDAGHLKESFLDYEVSFVNPDGLGNLNPRPPFKIKLPRTLKPNNGALTGHAISNSGATNEINVSTDYGRWGAYL